MPSEPTPDLTTTWEVVAIDPTGKRATVRFENPHYSGAHVTEAQRPVFNEAGEPTGETETYLLDQDPNPHAVKSVNVPMQANGQVDHEAFVHRLSDQARGVRHRMDAAHALQAGEGLVDLVGFSTPSP